MTKATLVSNETPAARMSGLYTIYDSAAEVHSPPHMILNHGAAIRVFTELCNDPKTQPGKNPEHFSLWYLGSYNELNGCFKADLAPLRIISGMEVLTLRPLPSSAGSLSPLEEMAGVANKP